MTPERWQQIKTLFDGVADLTADERSDFLDTACKDDEELRLEVESLLESEEEDVSIVDKDPADFFGRLLAGDLRETREGLKLGHYRLLEKIGHGGMAVVYKAARAEDDFRQEVAIKLIRQGMDNEMMVALFKRERQILAELDHPNIARLFDGGVTEGLPYLVMELIDGEPITAYCDRKRFSTIDRLELFRKVCHAVQYAHSNMIVHRDLKPSNILVTKDGVPKLLDFGIAKLTQSGKDDIDLTSKGYLTPGYASPEQITGEKENKVTAASDTYSLGVLLYHLLSGRRPYQIENLPQAEIARIICEEETERPSKAITRVTSQNRTTKPLPPAAEISRLRNTSPEELRRKLRGDLDNIVLMAMRKEPLRRYTSVEQLEEDVRRHLTGLPVIARESTVTYLVGKFARRHRAGVTAAILIVLSLVGSTIATTWQMRVAQRERLTAQMVSEFLVALFELSDPEKARGREIPAREIFEQSAIKINSLDKQPEVQAELMSTIGRVYTNLGMIPEAEPMLNQALEIQQQMLPENHPAIADSQTHVATLLADSGRYKEAEMLFREVLAKRRKHLNNDDERLADSELRLAQVLEQRGRLDEAEEFLHKALKRQYLVLGTENQWTAKTLNVLAMVLQGQSRLSEAVSLYRQALDMTGNQLGTDHPDYAGTLSNLAEVLCIFGEHAEALSLFKQVEALQIDVLGKDHWSLATTWNNLGICKRIIGDYQDAEELFTASLDLRYESLGPDHPYVAASLNNLGNLFYKKGDLAKAEPLLRQSVDIYKAVPGGPHFDHVGPLNNLALVLQDMGQLDEAEKIHREVLDANREVYGNVHERVARNLNNLGELLRRRGKTEDAANHFRQALEVGQVIFGPESSDLAIFHLNLANALRSLDQLVEAEAQYRASWALHRQIFGPRHPKVAELAVGLGRILMEQEQSDKAEPLLREAVDIFSEEQAQPNLSMAQATLGRCLTSLGSPSEARTLLRTAYEAFDQMHGRDGAWTQATLKWLAEIDN